MEKSVEGVQSGCREAIVAVQVVQETEGSQEMLVALAQEVSMEYWRRDALSVG